MKEILKTTKKMEKENQFLKQEIIMKEIFQIINLMVKDIIIGKKIIMNILEII